MDFFVFVNFNDFTDASDSIHRNSLGNILYFIVMEYLTNNKYH